MSEAQSATAAVERERVLLDVIHECPRIRKRLLAIGVGARVRLGARVNRLDVSLVALFPREFLATQGTCELFRAVRVQRLDVAVEVASVVEGFRADFASEPKTTRGLYFTFFAFAVYTFEEVERFWPSDGVPQAKPQLSKLCSQNVENIARCIAALGDSPRAAQCGPLKKKICADDAPLCPA